MRFQQAAGQVENHRQVRTLRREIARTMTVQIELERAAAAAEEEE
ncbi:MAG TPA: 50S ribosomal protein L29 [Candidatus Dormibacteraeota bacterium]|nr:50S ribosomal protein L29 [Candidatus Dormibacteraeota bacterium]